MLSPVWLARTVTGLLSFSTSVTPVSEAFPDTTENETGNPLLDVAASVMGTPT